jgi:tRNA(adenine34) deaminase
VSIHAAVICRDGMIVAESHDGDVTRHAEVAAISQAQKTLGIVSLEDCEIYMNVEPCALCSYVIRETRIRRVVYGLSSPHMGGVSKWNILGDTDICSAMADFPAFAIPIQGDPSRSTSIPHRRLAAVRAGLRGRRVAKSGV